MSLNFLRLALKLRYGLSRKAHLCKTQTISFLNPFDIAFPIIDLGGGGEGVIGQLYKENVTAVDSRQDELDEIPDGPIKICANAMDLPFEEHHFASATAFYFFMYLQSQDYKNVIKEAFRVLKPGGFFYIWDTVIPQNTSKTKESFIVPVNVLLPNKKITTAYGVKWANRDMSSDIMSDICMEIGFTIHSKTVDKNSFALVCQKPIDITKV